MRLLAIVAGLLFVVGIVAVFLHINSGKLWNGVDSKRANRKTLVPPGNFNFVAAEAMAHFISRRSSSSRVP